VLQYEFKEEAAQNRNEKKSPVKEMKRRERERKNQSSKTI
jgi:hypothetical protein